MTIPADLDRRQSRAFPTDSGFRALRPRVRGYAWQALLVLALAGLVWSISHNVYVNMQARGIPMGFGFWNQTAGFDINQTLIAYSALSTYGRAFWVGLLNTLLVAAIGIALATLLGFAIGVARLSPNFILAKLAMIYVEIAAQYAAAAAAALLVQRGAEAAARPAPVASRLVGVVFLQNRGLYLPRARIRRGRRNRSSRRWLWRRRALAWRYWARRRAGARPARRSRWRSSPCWPVVGLPLAAYFAAGRPIGFDSPQLRGFNFAGGLQILPEFVALVLGLVALHRGFIAEIVRAGSCRYRRGRARRRAALGLHRGADPEARRHAAGDAPHHRRR